ncbi:helix-turn-helix domain-containing protein [Bacillus solimangrovi]|uniref:HTH cro/C1-type domain-containing protein n=1 Tax=Bacillus solimangrovi TaxID=1305675 RepID=A0A1E5LES1_9BACI|nr:helix-turn-helix transcriptional regulator [Bacillus solimangrovi]OEH92569.1 hypothetical protein BFG57_15265 [Bacillus solimangrovi]
MNELGQKIRTIRTQKGIGLNALAKKLDISSGYLSNLETGKTDTVQLSIIPKLQQELNINWSDIFQSESNSTEQFNEIHFRIERLSHHLKELEKIRPDIAQYLISIVEQGIDTFQEGQPYH